MFGSCGPVQSVDVRDKPGPGEKAEKQRSKFFGRRTATVTLGGGGYCCFSGHKGKKPQLLSGAL